jgi:heparan-alpha-glucosaminide N-acetyltransferase
MPQRVQSIDIFRGLTILTMVFVNDLAGVANISAWMKHAPDGTDSMTFVDVVFPAFLFIVGMSIPMALQRRRDKGATTIQLWEHILIRSFGLLLLGLFMVNMSGMNPAVTGMNRALWSTLFYTGVIAVWAQPELKTRRALLVRQLIRIAGIATIIFLAIIYRSGDATSPGWMQPQWWGILGLIGWTYLVCSASYIVLGPNLPALIALVGLAVCSYIGGRTGAFEFLGPVNQVLWIGGHIGGHVSIAGAGMIGGMLFSVKTSAQTPKTRLQWLIAMAFVLSIAGYLLRPLYGISKNSATPAWSLYSAAICCLLFMTLYWLADLRGHGRLFGFSEPAGTNPLLAYILPDIFYCVLALVGLSSYWELAGDGAAGVARSLIFALVVVWVTGKLTNLGLRLRL